MHTNVISSKHAYIYSPQTLAAMCYSYTTQTIFLLPFFNYLNTVRFTISGLLLFQETFTSDSYFPHCHGFHSPVKQLNSSYLLVFLLLPAPTDLVSYVFRHGLETVCVCDCSSLTWAARVFRGYTCFFPLFF